MKTKEFNYNDKFFTFENKTLFEKLSDHQQVFIKEISFRYRLTFQEFRQVVEASRDLTMWGEGDLQTWWKDQNKNIDLIKANDKKRILIALQNYLDQLRSQEKVYSNSIDYKPRMREPNIVLSKEEDKTICGMCPVASEKTVCCNLHTIDAVENCLYGCSYCTIQTFYEKDILFQKNIKMKLDQIAIDPDRFYHFGTGQSSDSLAWGDRNGILEAHCQFAAEHPNILMEFKTKSKNIKFFIENDISKNVVCSWSLNTPVIIENEEHFTASLDERLKAARRLADSGTKVAFHFHPLIWYSGWGEGYQRIVDRLIRSFNPDEVLFVSFGSITLIKPVIQKIRDLGNPTKTLQMQLVLDPHGKLTYPENIKITLFKHLYKAFEPWLDKVFFYLCMEKASIWEESLGYVYKSNMDFEREFGLQTMKKCN